MSARNGHSRTALPVARLAAPSPDIALHVAERRIANLQQAEIRLLQMQRKIRRRNRAADAILVVAAVVALLATGYAAARWPWATAAVLLVAWALAAIHQRLKQHESIEP